MAKSMTGFGRGVYTDELRSVTVEHVKALAQKYFDTDNYVAVSLRPEEGAQGMAE